MACTDCFTNCDPLVTDRCVKYTGPEIPLLNICTGDTLSHVEAEIIKKLLELIDGEIDLPDLTLDCPYVQNLMGSQKYTLENFIQILLDGECDLDSRIKVLEQPQPPYSFDTACLTGNPVGRDNVIQATINKVCSIDTRVSTIENTYIKQADLCKQVLACLPENNVTQFNARMVPYTYVPYIGPLSNFDNTGKGLVSTGFDKIYLANGLNGTQDWRGRSPIGAIQNVPGATLDNNVDPSLPQNVGYNYSVNQKVGVSSVVLTTLQMPPHVHPVIDPGHIHEYKLAGNTGAGAQALGGVTNSSNAKGSTEMSVTNITIGSTGSGSAHTNLHPSIGCFYITFIP